MGIPSKYSLAQQMCSFYHDNIKSYVLSKMLTLVEICSHFKGNETVPRTDSSQNLVFPPSINRETSIAIG